MSLFKAITTKDRLTENGMPTNSTSSNYVLDMFFQMGGSRGMSTEAIDLMFSKALSEDRLLATKAMFYNRDIRGGQGERRSFRSMFNFLCIRYPMVAIANLENVPYFGRWDDILMAIGTPVERYALDFILSALKSGDKLCAKWMPRENKSLAHIAKHLFTSWGLSPEQYRKLLSGNTEVVENIMCQNEWPAIDYNHVPSVAINKYRTAFYRHDGERFEEWIASLSKEGTTNKIHADAIFPHDIVKRISASGASNGLLEAQWKALPNYMVEGRQILPVCDVSGSMQGDPMEICISLGLYLSERNIGPFKDGFITFSTNPELQLLHGTLAQRIGQLRTAQWNMSTDLEKVFRLILSKAISAHLPEEDMPTDILILSDMQFNQATGIDKSAIEMITGIYRQAGYRRPTIIFWNLRTSSGVPVKMDENGTALVSGFSPSIMKSVLGAEVSPIKIMRNVLDSERYSVVK